jgi:DNA-directed RNA polymerase subunit RPC12/RpoP
MMVRDLLGAQGLVKVSEVMGYRVQGAPEYVEKVCQDCGRPFWTVAEQAPVCGYCQSERNTKARIQAWYDEAPVLSNPGTFLFIGGPDHSIKELLQASSTREASEIAEERFGRENWYGCNIVELNEYHLLPDGTYSWGPKTNFLWNAVKEYYEMEEAG